MSDLKVAVICGSLQRPSRTLVLTQAIQNELAKYHHLTSHVVEIAQIGRALGACLQRSELPAAIEADLQAVEAADLIIAASPVYRASYTGLFKHFVDLIGLDVLNNKPILLAATGGSPLHTLMLDHQMRPLFAMMQSLVMPAGVFAAEADFTTDYQINSPALEKRITLAVELALPHLAKAKAQ